MERGLGPQRVVESKERSTMNNSPIISNMPPQVTPSLLAYLDDEGMRELGVVSVGARAKLRMAAQSVAGRTP